MILPFILSIKIPAPILFKIIISAVLAGFGLIIVGTFVVHMNISLF